MPFTVIYDANALYPMSLRDLLIRVGQTTLVRARWTSMITDEWVDALVRRRPELRDRLVRTVELMNAAIRDVLVTEFEDLIPGIELPDPDDRHVVAAAIRAGAQTVVTFNVRDFPKETLAKFGLEAQHPDEFVEHLLDLDGRAMAAIVRAMAADRLKPPMTPLDVVESLRKAGLVRSATVLRTLLESL